MDVPDDIKSIITWAEEILGESVTVSKEAHGDDSSVYQLRTASKLYFLKIKLDSVSGFAKERERLEWLKGKVPVPEAIGFFQEGETSAVLLSGIPGKNLKVMSKEWPVEVVIDRLVKALKAFHAVSTEDWPFDPADSNKVLLHGDACLPNFIFDGEELSGYIDVSEAHLGEVDEDLAAAVWSLDYNLGHGHGPAFLKAFGCTDISEETVERIRLQYETWQRAHGFLD